MKHKYISLQIIVALLMFVLNTSLYGKEDPTIGSRTIAVFEKINVRFDTNDFPTNYEEKGEIIWLTNGRIALKKITIPHHKRDTKITANVILTSNGDPWDKAGSLFVIPTQSDISMIGIAQGKQNYPPLDSTLYENLIGTVAGKDYLPTVELLRFMTPFGVGHFSNDTSSRNKPVYIDGWAKNVKWQQDISELIPLLEGEIYIGLYLDTWSKEGYNVSVKLTFDETPTKPSSVSKRKVLPLINTLMYMGQNLPDIFARKSVTLPFNIPQNAKNVQLKYLASGHGGHSGGDEFVRQEHILKLDNEEIYRFYPWRTDCASFRRYNPTSGNWLYKRKGVFLSEKGRIEKEIEEPISSSDLSRTNWCPGSDVPPLTIPLEISKKGNHTLTISIPKAQAATDKLLNHWLISAYLVWEE